VSDISSLARGLGSDLGLSVPKHVPQRPCVFSRKFMVRGLGHFAVSMHFILTPLTYREISGSSSSPTRPRSTPHFERSSEHGAPSYPGEEYELTPELDEQSKNAHRHRPRPHYCDGDTIDWWHEDASERERWKRLVSQYGFRGFILSFVHVTKLWFVIIFTGICVGLAGGWLDILVMW
jgi:hypothetical protein